MFQLRVDVNFLRSIQIMDYSLLVGVHTGELAGIILNLTFITVEISKLLWWYLKRDIKSYNFIGIIDIFQQYTAGKSGALFEDEIAEACNKRWGRKR